MSVLKSSRRGLFSRREKASEASKARAKPEQIFIFTAPKPDNLLGCRAVGLLGGDCVVAFGLESANSFAVTAVQAWSVLQ